MCGIVSESGDDIKFRYKEWNGVKLWTVLWIASMFIGVLNLTLILKNASSTSTSGLWMFLLWMGTIQTCSTNEKKQKKVVA